MVKERVESVFQPEQFEEYLRSFQIPIENWSKNGTKTPIDLLKEVNEGDSKLIVENGKLIRLIQPVFVDVFVTANGQRYKLVEEKQVFKADGRVRSRIGILEGSIGEKSMAGESPFFAATRGIREEMAESGLNLENLVLTLQSSSVVEEDSNSYPGLTARKAKSLFSVELEHDQEPQPFQEDQDRKITYFIWQPVETQLD